MFLETDKSKKKICEIYQSSVMADQLKTQTDLFQSAVDISSSLCRKSVQGTGRFD